MYYYVEKTPVEEDIIECEVADDDEIEAAEEAAVVEADEAAEESTEE